MTRAYKTVPCHCPECGQYAHAAPVSADAPEPFAQAYPCGWCQDKEYRLETERSWAESDKAILEMMARENGGKVFTCLQLGGGEYEYHYYELDLFGLREMEKP